MRTYEGRNVSQEAPGALETVRAFVNSVDLEDEAEELSSPAALATWLREHDLLDGGARADRRRPRAGRSSCARRCASCCSATTATTSRPGAAGRSRPRRGARGSRCASRPTASRRSRRRAAGVDGALGRLLAIVADGAGRRDMGAAEGVPVGHLPLGVLRPLQEPLGRAGATWPSAATAAKAPRVPQTRRRASRRRRAPDAQTPSSA